MPTDSHKMGAFYSHLITIRNVLVTYHEKRWLILVRKNVDIKQDKNVNIIGKIIPKMSSVLSLKETYIYPH